MGRTRILAVWLPVAAVTLLLLGPDAAAPAGLPPRFFGVVPQQTSTDADARWMSAGGIETVRVAVSWATVEPAPPDAPAVPGDPVVHHFDWSRLDRAVEAATSHGLEVLPFLYRTPGWMGTDPAALPTGSAAQLEGWRDFVGAAVRRYGPGGEFWSEHSPVSEDPLPLRPIRRWQIWNEENYFYFAYPVSPSAYSKVLADSAEAIRDVDPGATVVLGGLYGRPRGTFPKAMPAAAYLRRLYAIPGARKTFDQVAVHPYAPVARRMRKLVFAVRRVIVAHHDDAPLLITEFGWGSQNDTRRVSFERGIAGQRRQLRRSYRMLIAARRRLKLRRVYWFSWKDAVPGSCRICNSTGLFHAGAGFDPKPAWRVFTGFTGGHHFPY